MANGDTIALPEVTVSPGVTTSGEPGVGNLVSGAEQVSIGGRDFFQVQRPPYLTRAVLVVNGMEYYEWTTVEVHREYNGNPPATFRFTVSEQESLTSPGGPVVTTDPNSAFRIRPPDKCQIYLDGYLVINGFVSTRQVYYDANQHAVELQGMDWSGRDGMAPAVSQTGEFKDQSLMQIAQAVEKQIGVKVTQEGGLASQKIPKAVPEPGETAFEFIERLARQVGAYSSSNAMGDKVLSDGTAKGGAQLIEGYNIVTGREVIHTLMKAGKDQMIGQMPGGDNVDYAQANQMKSDAGSGGQNVQPGSGARSLMEIPFFSQMLGKMRAQHEQSIGDDNLIQVNCTVLGWRKEGGGLWWPFDEVYVKSPMLILDRTLTIKAVTFRQSSNGGTTTEIEAVNLLGSGRTPMGGGGGGGGQE